jgi:Tesmin/TSO1-like CXC domain, cysteine-rich domain
MAEDDVIDRLSVWKNNDPAPPSHGPSLAQFVTSSQGRKILKKRAPAPVGRPCKALEMPWPELQHGPLVEEEMLPAHTNPATVYAPLLIQNRKRDLESSVAVSLPPRIIGGLRDQIQKVKRCACRNVKCLQLYCLCFTSGVLCGSQCTCTNCFNKDASICRPLRNKAILRTLKNDPFAFHPSTKQLASAASQMDASHAKPSGRSCSSKKNKCDKVRRAPSFLLCSWVER